MKRWVSYFILPDHASLEQGKLLRWHTKIVRTQQNTRAHNRFLHCVTSDLASGTQYSRHTLPSKRFLRAKTNRLNFLMSRGLGTCKTHNRTTINIPERHSRTTNQRTWLANYLYRHDPHPIYPTNNCFNQGTEVIQSARTYRATAPAV